MLTETINTEDEICSVYKHWICTHEKKYAKFIIAGENVIQHIDVHET